MNTPKRKNNQVPLSPHFDESNDIEIGVDEAGRGPLFGRLYVAGVVLPKSTSDFKFHLLKDSKKFHSPKKIKEVEQYIKENAIAWHVSFAEADEIDSINIRQAVLKHMRLCCSVLLEKTQPLESPSTPKVLLLIDGNDFPAFTKYDESKEEIVEIPSITIEGGDNTYCAIAGASILAKVARDEYIEQLCAEHPELHEHYNLLKNKGYGTKAHIDGIKMHGITQWHRKSYSPCNIGATTVPSSTTSTTTATTTKKKNTASWAMPY